MTATCAILLAGWAALGPGEPSREGRGGASAPVFRLLDKRSAVTPGRHADALTHEGKIDIQSPSPNALEVRMTGAVAAHAFLGFRSMGIQTYQLVQEFDLTSEGGTLTEANLALSVALKGYLRSQCKGAAGLRLAGATVAPAGGGRPLLELRVPPACVAGARGEFTFDQPPSTPASATVPAGRYVLVVDLVLEASAGGLVNARGVADFSPADLPDTWKQDHDPFKDMERKDFGFVVSLKATALTGKAPAVAARQP
jgi:hypothetical protein